MSVVWHGLRDAFLMAWQVWWALVFGFAISAVVQAWVPRSRIERTLGGPGVRPVAIATAFGAASSSCSYAAIAIAKSLFQKGASAASSLAFQFASTNLVAELGIVIWVLIGWRFTLADFVGGLLLIIAMALLLRAFVSSSCERSAREHALAAASGHVHPAAGASGSVRARLRSLDAWSAVAHNFRGDWAMLYREILAGFVLAGFVAQLPRSFFNALFAVHADGDVKLVENTLAGPVIAIASFVCSIGNVPLAAVLWSHGIGFAGVMAFIFSDLVVLPIVWIYRKYYGTSFALRITALMLVAIVLAALVLDGLFGLAGLIPRGRPTHADIFAAIGVDYRLFTNLAGLAVFACLLALSLRRGVSDPVCGMKLDRASAVTLERAGRTFFFCSERCARAFQPHAPEPAARRGGLSSIRAVASRARDARRSSSG